MASGDILMDWEPDVPGQFHPPHRLRRKRPAEVLDTSSDLEPPFIDTFHPSQVSSLEQPRAGFFATIVLVTYRIIERLFSFPITRFKARRRELQTLTDTRQIVEVRRLGSDGSESVKRRGVDVAGPAISKRRQLLSPKRLPSRFASPSPRKMSSSTSSSRRSLQRPTSGRAADLSQIPIMSGALETVDDRQLNSSNPPPPTVEIATSIPGAETLSRIRLSLNPPALPGDGSQVNSNRLTSFGSTQNMRSESQQRPDSRKVLKDGSVNNVKKVGANLGRRHSHPDRPSGAMIHPLPLDSDASNTESSNPSTVERHVRIALNPHNGLPQERVVKFFKESMIGEWAPSSPWSNDQVNNAQSNLEGNLLALIQDTMSPLPPPTPPPRSSRSSSRMAGLTRNSLPEHENPSKPIIGSKSGVWEASPSDLSSLASSSSVKSLQASESQPPSPQHALRDSSLAASSILPVGCPGSPDPRSASQTRVFDSAPLVDSNGMAGMDERVPDLVATPVLAADEVADMFLELAMSDSMKDKRAERKRRRDEAKAAKRAAEEAAAARAKEEAEREALARFSLRRMPKQKFIQALSEDWEARIDEAMRKGEHIPLTTTVNGTELRRKDLMTVLGEREWLNDEIINAYLEWIVEYANEKAGKNGRTSIPRVIAHNSFFYKKIATDGPKSVSRWMKRKRAEGKKLLEVEQVLIPVNNAAHWTLLVVCPKTRTVEYLDSFGGPSKVFIKNTLAWLQAELGDAWNEDEWKVLDTRSAQQFNGYDCGVFTITNAECVAGSILTDSYDAGDMAAQRRRIAAVLLNRGFGGELVAGQEL